MLAVSFEDYNSNVRTRFGLSNSYRHMLVYILWDRSMGQQSNTILSTSVGNDWLLRF